MKSLAKTINSDKNMTDNKMTPEQITSPESFTEAWLSNYEERNINKEDQVRFSGDYRIGIILENAMFSEALAAYTDHIRKEACEKQKEECAEAWHYAIAEIGEPYYESINKAIRNAPAPEFKITEK